MSSKSYDMTQNPMPINRIELGFTKQTRQLVINLLGGVLNYPVLVIPQRDFSLLLEVGIDPNALKHGETTHVRLLAYWELAANASERGTPYKNVIRLVNADPEKLEQMELQQLHREILAELQKQTGLLEAIQVQLLAPFPPSNKLH